MPCRRGGCAVKKILGDQERRLAQRKRFRRLRERYGRRGKHLVYVDEGGFAPAVTRRYAYAPKGQRVDGLTPGQRTPRTSLSAARMDGELPVPFLFDGMCDTEVFHGWLETLLCPRLTAAQVVIMDKVTCHTSSQPARLIAETGAPLLFLSPYSPDFNPIAHDFAARKKHREYNGHESLDTIVKHYQSFRA